MLRHLAGLEPEKLSPRLIKFHPGSLAVAGSTTDILSSDVAGLTVDIDTVGVNGRDRSSFGAEYFPYFIRNGSTLACVFSHAFSYGGVILPAGGWTHARKHMASLPFNARWGGFPDFHFKDSFLKFTDPLAPVVSRISTAGAWKPISVASFVPDSARLALIRYILYGGTRAGSGYIRSAPATLASAPGSSLGTVQGTEEQAWPEIVRITSARMTYVKTTGDARISVIVEGYWQTEPS